LISCTHPLTHGLDNFALKLEPKEDFEELLRHMQRMKIEVLMDDSNKVNKESFFILDPDKIKIQVYN
jgi:catechol-2,3-dioxygenase